MNTLSRTEIIILTFISTLLLYGSILSFSHPIVFKEVFALEDGFIEWATVVALLCAMIVSGKRFLALRSQRPPLFLFMTILLTLFCFFGAGEEISWGQRIFDIKTPKYFQENNAQEELGFHNLTIEINGETVKLNKLIFGTGLAIMMLIYLAVLTPLYRKGGAVKRFLDRLAVPMPENYHIISYIVLLLVVEGIMDSSKRGEMTEFVGSFIFMLNIAFPYNRQLFYPQHDLEENS